MPAYSTAKVAAIIGVHPNTVRFYEEQGLLPKIPRAANNYRIFSERHLKQLRLIRTAFRAEVLSNNLRNEAVGIVKSSANGEYEKALRKTLIYQKHIEEEIYNAREAIELAEKLLGNKTDDDTKIHVVGRREAAAQIGISTDVLRDWERNGLIHVPRQGNRRKYGITEINRLKIIRILRHANYSQMSVRRMFSKLSQGKSDLLSAIDTPDRDEDIISAADRYITSLLGAYRDTKDMAKIIESMKQ